MSKPTALRLDFIVAARSSSNGHPKKNAKTRRHEDAKKIRMNKTSRRSIPSLLRAFASSRLVCSKSPKNVLLLAVVPAWRRAMLKVMRTRPSAHARSRLGPQRPSRSKGQADVVSFHPNSRQSCQAVRPVARHARIRKAGIAA